MRAFKYIALSFLALVVGLFAYLFVIDPAIWYSKTKQDSYRILKAAQSPVDLTNAVGELGWFIPLTNDAWIAIRYRDVHDGVICSSAVARDSGGAWFESDRHFCGRFSFWPNLKEEVAADQEQRKLTPDLFKNRIPLAEEDSGSFPSYREMLAIESATNLENARSALQKIGFKEIKQ